MMMSNTIKFVRAFPELLANIVYPLSSVGKGAVGAWMSFCWLDNNTSQQFVVFEVGMAPCAHGFNQPLRSTPHYAQKPSASAIPQHPLALTKSNDITPCLRWLLVLIIIILFLRFIITLVQLLGALVCWMVAPLHQHIMNLMIVCTLLVLWTVGLLPRTEIGCAIGFVVTMRYQRMHRNTFERQKTSKRQCVHRIPPHKSPPLTQGIHFINAASTEHLRGPFLDTKPCFGWTFDVQKHVVLSVCNPTWLSSIQFISFPAFHHHFCSTSWCSCVLDGRLYSL
eukprot:649528_1